MDKDLFIAKWCTPDRPMRQEMMQDLDEVLDTDTLDGAFKEGYARALEEMKAYIEELREG